MLSAPILSPHRAFTRHMTSRKRTSSVSTLRSREGAYSSLPRHHPTLNNAEWPAPASQIKTAEAFLRACAISGNPILLLPDKDADGICATLIVYRTLFLLNPHLDPSLVNVHFVEKGSNVHSLTEKDKVNAYGAKWTICVDQGSRPGPSLNQAEGSRALIVDHHCSDEFPKDAEVLSSAHNPPVATSSLLAYALCCGLHVSVPSRTDFLCAIGTMGDLGTAIKWDSKIPSGNHKFGDIREQMRTCEKKFGKKKLGDIVALINAPRRTALYDPISAWNALLERTNPLDLLSPSISPHIQRLHQARHEVRVEIERCSKGPGTGPTFSEDGRVALVRIRSGASIHPVIATRWANMLKSSKLEIVICANNEYLTLPTGSHSQKETISAEDVPMTNFSCRIAKRTQARGHGEEAVDVIQKLLEYANRVPGLRERMGDDFARGHKEASGGIVRSSDFEELWGAIRGSESEGNGQGPRKRRRKADSVPNQTNTLETWVRRGHTQIMRVCNFTHGFGGVEHTTYLRKYRAECDMPSQIDDVGMS